MIILQNHHVMQNRKRIVCLVQMVYHPKLEDGRFLFDCSVGASMSSTEWLARLNGLQCSCHDHLGIMGKGVRYLPLTSGVLQNTSTSF